MNDASSCYVFRMSKFDQLVCMCVYTSHIDIHVDVSIFVTKRESTCIHRKKIQQKLRELQPEFCFVWWKIIFKTEYQFWEKIGGKNFPFEIFWKFNIKVATEVSRN